jgi:hypothetical protein
MLLHLLTAGCGTFEPWTDVRSTTAFEGYSDIEATSPQGRVWTQSVQEAPLFVATHVTDQDLLQLVFDLAVG